MSHPRVRGFGATIICLIALGCGKSGTPNASAPGASGNKPLNTPLPKEITKAWLEKGEAVGGWMVYLPDAPYDAGTFRQAPEGTAREVPGFQIGWKPGLVQDLPAPSAAFGLLLGGDDLNDAALKEFAKFRELRVLVLSGTKVTGAGLGHLTALQNLEVLTVPRECADEDLRQLPQLPKLHTLDLSQSKITDAGLKHIGHLKGVKSLRLMRTGVTSAGIKELAPLENLEFLSVMETNIGDAGLKELSACKRLRAVYYDGISTDEGVKHLAQLPHLEELLLNHTQVTDAGLQQFAACQSLRTLVMLDTPNLSLAGIEKLQKARPDLKISHTIRKKNAGE